MESMLDIRIESNTFGLIRTLVMLLRFGIKRFKILIYHAQWN